jgi:hypothetical protein
MGCKDEGSCAAGKAVSKKQLKTQTRHHTNWRDVHRCGCISLGKAGSGPDPAMTERYPRRTRVTPTKANATPANLVSETGLCVTPNAPT